MDLIKREKNIIEDLKPLFIEAFTMFYGKEYRDKIEKTFSDLIVVFVGKNMSYDDIAKEQEYILYFLKEFLVGIGGEEVANNVETFISDVNDGVVKQSVEFPLIIEQLCLEYDYYNLLRDCRVNDWDIFVLLGIMGTVNRVEERMINKCLKSSANSNGFALIGCDRPIFVVNGAFLNVVSIIHEINHLFSKEKLVEIYDDRIGIVGSFKHYGIESKGNLNYEIINELMAMEIFNIFCDLCEDEVKKNVLLDYGEKSGYLQIDQVSFGVVSYIYELLKSDIKVSFATGMGNKIKKIIGESNCDDLNSFLYKNYEDILKLKREKGEITFEEYMASRGNKRREEADMIKSNFQKAYSDYLDYSLSLDKYVDNLVDVGKARKVK